MNDTPTNRQAPLVLAEERVARQGLRMTYRLSLREPNRIYSISVFSDGDGCTEEVGSDLFRATAFYRAVRDGFVTPCALSEVLADLRVEEGAKILEEIL